MHTPKRSIGVAAWEDLDATALKVIAAHIAAYFYLPAEVLPCLEAPRQAFDTNRQQYDAGRVIQALEQLEFAEVDKLVAVCSADVFVPLFTHVFGEARQGGRCAVVSLFRLEPRPEKSAPLSALGYERAAKVALHELGHLFNLYHCEEQNCLMHFAGDLEDLDRTPPYLCRHCAAAFKYQQER